MAEPLGGWGSVRGSQVTWRHTLKGLLRPPFFFLFASWLMRESRLQHSCSKLQQVAEHCESEQVASPQAPSNRAKGACAGLPEAESQSKPSCFLSCFSWVFHYTNRKLTDHISKTIILILSNLRNIKSSPIVHQFSSLSTYQNLLGQVEDFTEIVTPKESDVYCILQLDK